MEEPGPIETSDCEHNFLKRCGLKIGLFDAPAAQWPHVIIQCWTELLYISTRALLCCTKCEIRKHFIVNIDRLQCATWKTYVFLVVDRKLFSCSTSCLCKQLCLLFSIETHFVFLFVIFWWCCLCYSVLRVTSLARDLFFSMWLVLLLVRWVRLTRCDCVHLCQCLFSRELRCCHLRKIVCS